MSLKDRIRAALGHRQHDDRLPDFLRKDHDPSRDPKRDQAAIDRWLAQLAKQRTKDPFKRQAG